MFALSVAGGHRCALCSFEKFGLYDFYWCKLGIGIVIKLLKCLVFSAIITVFPESFEFYLFFLEKSLIIGFANVIIVLSYHVYSFLTGRLGSSRRLTKGSNSTGSLIKAMYNFFYFAYTTFGLVLFGYSKWLLLWNNGLCTTGEVRQMRVFKHVDAHKALFQLSWFVGFYPSLSIRTRILKNFYQKNVWQELAS